MDLFATLTFDEFNAFIMDPSRMISDEKVMVLLDELRTRRSINFTGNISNDSGKSKSFRICATFCGNGTHLRIIARDILDQLNPTIPNFDLQPLVETYSKQTVGPKDVFLSVPTESLIQQVVTTFDAKSCHNPIPDGLCVVFGGTGSGKTVLADRLSIQALRYQGFEGHALRYGDPVEGAFEPWSQNGVCFGDLSEETPETQRNIGDDVPGLKEFHIDALRQKPAIITIGELRNREDMVEALRLSTTGHLVIATAHAGSLSEGFLRLMDAYGCFEHPELREPLVNSLRLVVHVRSTGKVPISDRKYKMILPTTWTRTEKSRHRFIADGVKFMNPSVLGRSDCIGHLGFLSNKDIAKRSVLIGAADSIIDEMMAAGLTCSIPTSESLPCRIITDVRASLKLWLKPFEAVVGLSRVDGDSTLEVIVAHLATRVVKESGALTFALPPSDDHVHSAITNARAAYTRLFQTGALKK